MNWGKYKEQKFISHCSRDLVVQVHGPCVWWAPLLHHYTTYGQLNMQTWKEQMRERAGLLRSPRLGN